MGIKRLFRARKSLMIVMMLVALALPASAHAAGGVHVVQPGENLYRIALQYGTSVSALVQANGLPNANFIWVGQRLTIPGGGSTASTVSTSAGDSVHVVQRGETLSSIALRYGTSVSALMAANGLSNSNFIWVGQRLRVSGSTGVSTNSSSSGGSAAASSGGGVHVVQRGETLYGIALRYGTSVQALVTANGLRSANLIWVGQRLSIPGGSSTTSSTSSTSATSSTSGSSGGNTGRWIDVDLSSQTVLAYEGDTVVRSMIVSTGIARYPTPTGQFHVYAKYASVNMSGPGYYLPGVPHTMFFYKGYALHGTYWHNNFGTPMSHGCVNLTRDDAAWLYSWTPVGTLVVIHK